MKLKVKMISPLKSKFSQSLCVLCVMILFSEMFSTFVYADTQRFIDYRYDEAGNLISIHSEQNLGPPDVTSLSPAFVNKESFAFITANGINLSKAAVSVNALGVALLDVTNVSETELKFTLSVDNTALIGLVPVTFTTQLGSDTENIVVAERTPVVSTSPNPIILTPNGQGVSVLLTFDQPFATDQIYDIAITDTNIATVADNTITLLAGETEVSNTVTGLTVGSTTLEINQLSNFLALGIPVIVNDDQLPVGSHTFYAKSLGVSAYIEPTLDTTGIFATQRPLGVAAYIQPTLDTMGIFATQAPLGAVYGTIISQVTPTTVSRGTAATLILEGFELDAVTAVSFNPGDGITQTAAFTVTSDGSQMTIPISITSGATTGTRAITLTTPAGDQRYSQGVINVQ